MKKYIVKTEKISTVSAVMVQKCLNDTVEAGWTFKQIVINEAMDEYMIIFEEDV